MERRGIGPEVLDSDYSMISNWRELPGAEEAASLISRTIASCGKILVYGDFDADGVTATATAVRVLRHLGAEVESHIPCRFSEGYGLGAAGVKRCIRSKVQLVVTVDCGITSIEPIARLKKSGISVIVTDHHVPGTELPAADVIVNPEITEDSGQPWRHLSGAGVIHTVLRGLFSGELPEVMHPDLVAIGTICDMVELKGDNRLLVKEGLYRMRRSPSPGICALLRKAGIQPETLSAVDLGFDLGPRINSAGRISHADSALSLLLASDSRLAEELASELDRTNAKRRLLDSSVFTEALKELENSDSPVAVAASSSWHPGVLGISASKLASRLNRPVVLVSWDGETGRGSARGITGKPVHSVLASAYKAGLLERFGGHSMAAGITVHKDKYSQFAEFVAEEASKTFVEPGKPVLYIDGGLNPVQCDFRVLEALEKVGPFGQGNPEPVWMSRNMYPSSWRVVGKEGRHLQMTFQKNGIVLRAIGFDMGNRTAELERPLDIAFQLKPDKWRGNGNVQLVIQDIKPAAVRIN